MAPPRRTRYRALSRSGSATARFCINAAFSLRCLARPAHRHPRAAAPGRRLSRGPRSGRILTTWACRPQRRVHARRDAARGRDRVRVDGIKQHERSPDSQPRIRSARTRPTPSQVGVRAHKRLRARTGHRPGFRPAPSRTIPDDRLLHAPLGKSRDSRARIRRPRPILHGHLPTAASARRRPISRRRRAVFDMLPPICRSRGQPQRAVVSTTLRALGPDAYSTDLRCP